MTLPIGLRENPLECLRLSNFPRWGVDYDGSQCSNFFLREEFGILEGIETNKKEILSQQIF